MEVGGAPTQQPTVDGSVVDRSVAGCKKEEEDDDNDEDDDCAPASTPLSTPADPDQSSAQQDPSLSSVLALNIPIPPSPAMAPPIPLPVPTPLTQTVGDAMMTTKMPYV
jgi:hypothetical protein